MAATSPSADLGTSRGESAVGKWFRGWVPRLQRLLPSRRAREQGGDVGGQSSEDKRRKRRRRWFIALVVALLSYPVLGTLALWTGFVEWVVRDEDVRLELDNPAYTIWPGRIHAQHVKILVNGETQFILEGSDLVVNIEVLELFRHRVHVTELAAHGVRYQMRIQVKDPKGIEERLAAYPSLPGLPGKNVVHEQAAQAEEPRESEWTVEVDGLDISVQELWFFEYRYLGDGRLRGAFLVGPKRMRVNTAVQELGPGELRFGEKETIATDFRGQITADIPEVNPEEHADTSFLELVSSRTSLQANVQSLRHVSAYLDGMDVSRGAGPLALDLYMDKGWLGTKSRFDYRTDSIRLKGDGFGVETDWRVEFVAAAEKPPAEGGNAVADRDIRPGDSGKPLLKLWSKASYVSLAQGNREFTIQIHEHHEEAALDRIRLSGETKLQRAAIRMPDIRSVDLDDLGVLFGSDAPVSFSEGELRGSASLDMDENYWIRGPVEAKLRDAKLQVAGVNLSGNTTFAARARVNPKQKTNVLEDAKLELRNIGMHVGDEDVDGWWMNVTAPRLALYTTEPARSESTFSIRAKDLEPVLESLAEKDVINDLIAKFTSLDDFRAKVTVLTKGDITDAILESESDVWDASGRVYTNGKEQRMALVVGGQAVSLGIADLGGGLELMPFAKTGWLNERLQSFPKPLVRMQPDKP